MLGRLLGIVLLVFTATGLFAQLQLSLNRAWEVEPDPEQGGVKRFFLKRLLSLGMILVVAFLLMVSTVVSTVITEVIRVVKGASPDLIARVVSVGLDNLMTLLLGMLLFAAIYKVLPDADMAWRDTWVGAAFFTSTLHIPGRLTAIIMRCGRSW